MKRWASLIAVALSTTTATPKIYWAIFGEVEVSTMTPPGLGISTGPVSNVILKSPTTPDCYTLTVTPNGTIGTKWTKCPQ